jgi:hypothetical protein
MIMKKFISSGLVLSILAMTVGWAIPTVDAASLTGLSDTMSEETISTASSHVIKFTTPTGVTATGQSIIVTFPAGFNFTSKVISGLTLTYGASTGLETSTTISATPGASTQWGAVFSGTNQVVLTLTSPTAGTYIAAGNKVILTYSSTNSINPSSAANYSISINANNDTGSISVPIITNDQVAITATVAQTLSFSISSNSINFGTLDSAATRWANTSTGSGSEVNAFTLAASTNGTSGYTITLSGDTLKSGSNSIAALTSTATALATGTAQFGIRMPTPSGGSGTVTAPFNDASKYAFGTAPLSQVSVASASGPSATTTYGVDYAANISALTPAGNYTTTHTYVATANF